MQGARARNRVEVVSVATAWEERILSLSGHRWQTMDARTFTHATVGRGQRRTKPDWASVTYHARLSCPGDRHKPRE